MRKIPLYLILAVLLALAQGCSLKHSLGYVNNDLAWRVTAGDIKGEVSLGCGIQNNFADFVTENISAGIYRSTETGVITADIPLGLACYYRVYNNDVFNLSAGIKYTNYFRAGYAYEYYYDNYSDVRHYHYSESLKLDLFNSNRVSLMFPDAEIKCPFSDNLKFTLSVELLYIGWRYNGGNTDYDFWQDVSTSTTYTEGGNPGSITAPGAVNSVKGGSDIFSLGAINLGILYYF